LVEKYYSSSGYFTFYPEISGEAPKPETSGTPIFVSLASRVLQYASKKALTQLAALKMASGSAVDRFAYTAIDKVLSRQENLDDLNTIAAFLSQSETIDEEAETVYMLAGNAVLSTTAALFDHLATLQGPAIMVISGGIGHSTEYLYEAIRSHDRFHTLSESISNLPEALVLEDVLSSFWPALVEAEQESRLRILAEEKSTNCGANANETKRVLDEADIKPKRIVLVQDPTMSLRTKASLEKAYETDPSPPRIAAWTITPRLGLSVEGKPIWLINEFKGMKSVDVNELWSTERFVSLVMGEIPRLRDDKAGYGPNGAGFIGHVNIPEEVESAWQRLNMVLTGDGGPRDV